MYQNIEKAAPGATNTESGTEQKTNLSVSYPGEMSRAQCSPGIFRWMKTVAPRYTARPLVS